MTSPTLTIFFPSLNEAKNLSTLIPQAIEFLKSMEIDGEVVIVDDGSTDGTSALVKKYSLEYPNLRYVAHEENKGYGAALRTGINAAKKEWVFWTDADMQFRLDSLPQFLQYTSEYEAIIGYRSHRADTFIRRLNGELYTQLIRFLFHIHVRDVDCAYKLIKTDVVQSLPLQSAGAFTSAEILINLSRRHVHIKQLSVPHFPRKYGSPTGGSLRVIFKGLRETLLYYLAK